MTDIIVAFPKIEDAKNLRKLLNRNGYDIAMLCDTGAQIISAVNELDSGIVICGYHFPDMHFSEINEYLPESFQMLLLASPAKLAENDVSGLVSISMPFRLQDLLNTLEMMLGQYRRRKKKQKKPKTRSASDQRKLDAVKALLMERNQMTEEEAHRYLQKLSMDSGTGLIETAEMILELNGKEWDL